MFFVSAVLGLLAFPALTAAAVLLLLDRHLGTSFYLPEGIVLGQTADPETGAMVANVLEHEGGTPLLFQHLFWFLGHPEVYVIVLPAIGVAFEVLSTHARKRPFGYRPTVWCLIVIAFLSMIVWGHHMFASGMNPYLGEYFSIATVLITLPFAVVGVNLLATLWKSRIRTTTAMYFGLGLVSAIGLGGFGGLFLGTATSDIYLHETAFVVGHFHLMIGTVTFFGIFAGIYHWFPKMFGRVMNEGMGKLHFWMTCPAMLTIWIMMHFQGMGGLLRRTFDHRAYEFAHGPAKLDLTITALGFVLMAGQLVFLWNFFRSAFRGEKAADNPWESTTLEWTTSSPPGHGNWKGELPVVTRDPYDYGPAEDGADFAPQGELRTS
jgi:cytochrome c oxidase subunit 1